MKLYRTTAGVIIESADHLYRHQAEWDAVVNRPGLLNALKQDIADGTATPVSLQWSSVSLLAPAQSQEVWAAGVTYIRSKVARMEESDATGASRFYDLVYSADRPELFFKCPAWRLVPPGGKVTIRNDSSWNVPEPELTLFITSAGTIEGYTIGNDMSSRSIEGENPLYLPQAKIWDGAASMGPCLHVPAEPPGKDTVIALSIRRNGEEIFSGTATLGQMKRSLEELASWLTRSLTFPAGVLLMTGTCLVPGDGFTLQSGDSISMSITGIGELHNQVS